MFWNDIRFGLRMLRRDPAFTAVAVLTLALGIGANTAIFTLFNAILLQSLPVREPARLVLFSDERSEGTFTGNTPSGRWTLFSFELFEFLSRQRLPLEAVAAVRSGQDPMSVRLPDATQAERAQGQLVSGAYFRVMGVDAARGRTFGPDDDRPTAAPVAVVSDGFWVERLHADPGAVGSVAMVNGMAFTIVGITPREFFGERVRRPPDFWIPLVFQPQIELRPSYLDRTDWYWLNVIGRLSPGSTRREAQSAVTTALQQFLIGKESATISDERRREIRESRVELADGAAGISSVRFRYSEPLHVLLAVVALVLLLACANVGNLLLSRAAAREAEITVRMALGVGRARLIRQLLTESLLLAVCGAVGGVLLARWVVSALLSLIVTKGSPVHGGLDVTVLAFAIGVTAFAGIVFGLAPAVSAGRVDLVTALKTRGRGAMAGRGRLGFTRTLVVAQIAISLVLLVGANLFARSLINLESRPLGFDPEGVLLARVNPRLAGYTPTTVAGLHRKLFERVSAMPGVRSATVARYHPLGDNRSINSGAVEGYSPKPDESVRFETVQVGPAYPATLGMSLLRGRPIGLEDVVGTPRVGMVNAAFVRRYFPNENPLGRHFGVNSSRQQPDVEIVGVVDDARFQNSRDIEPTVFVAMLQEQSQFALDAEVEIRTAGDPAAASNALRRAIAEVDPNLPVNDTRTLRAQVAGNFDSQRLAARLVSFFGGLALLLACVGLYGVVTQSVVRRTSEIGVRMALGAQRRDVMWMILRDVLVLLVLGLIVGVPAALASTRAVASQIHGLQSAAPASFAIAIVLLAVIAVVTGLAPARRATRLDPLLALRDQ